jgi:hypothetical protein
VGTPSKSMNRGERRRWRGLRSSGSPNWAWRFLLPDTSADPIVSCVFVAGVHRYMLESFRSERFSLTSGWSKPFRCKAPERRCAHASSAVCAGER